MFLMGKNKPAPPPLDPEQAKQRQAFLSSGVPDELKKQTAVRLASLSALDYPPLPEVSHVQQVCSSFTKLFLTVNMNWE